MFDSISIKEIATIALASVGAVLGVINTWKAFDKDRPKIKLIPKRSVFMVNGQEDQVRLCFNVLNLSTFPMTITEVGVRYRWSNMRGPVVLPIITDGKEFPRKLEPRTSFSAYAQPGALKNQVRRIRCAYVKTDCGLLFEASSPAFREMVREQNRLP